MTENTTESEAFEEFEEKMEELNDGLLTAYAAGFSQAVDTFKIDAGFDTDFKALKLNGAIQESHYYFWDGRTKPLELWLQDQFGLYNDTENDRGPANDQED